MNNRGQARGSRPRGGGFNSNRRGGQSRWIPRGVHHSPTTDRHPPHRHSPQVGAGAGAGGPSADDYSSNKEYLSNGERESPQQILPSSFSNYSEDKSAFSSASRPVWRPSATKGTPSHVESLKEGHNSIESSRVKGDLPSLSTPNHPRNLHIGVERLQIREPSSKMTGESETSLPSKSEADNGPFPINNPVNTADLRKPELPEHLAFDLCPTKAGSCVTLKAPLLVQNRERRNEIKRSMEQKNGEFLQPGMVHLKSYLSVNDQINIVKQCRDLGLGPGGFYQPGYRDGAKLNLKMMCLGKNWDPETNEYGDVRPLDGAKPPSIPVDLFQLVESAIKESHSFVRKNSKVSNPEGVLPRMVPDICIVNFYSSTGRLGLHQDRDESEQSLRKGLPVVSFSIGDTAEFLYCDQRDAERANMVFLESGDVLIFGGKSRHVFHGVASIQQNTAPKTLLEKTNLRPGRLNLTFREY